MANVQPEANYDAELARAGANVQGGWSYFTYLVRRFPLGAIGAVIVASQTQKGFGSGLNIAIAKLPTSESCHTQHEVPVPGLRKFLITLSISYTLHKLIILRKIRP